MRCDCGLADISKCDAMDCRATAAPTIGDALAVLLPEHSELGASSCYRWWACPASVQASQGYADRPSEAARRGTAEHRVAELCLRSGQDAIEYVGRVVEGIEIDEPAADRVQEYLDDCRNLMGQPGAIWGVEEKFNLAKYDPPAPMYGTVDFWVYFPLLQLLVIRDYKSGWLFVDPTTPQGKYYACGAIIKLTALGYAVSHVRVGINQPRKGGLKEHTYDAMELAAWSADLIDHARATMTPDAPFQAGSHCRFCRKSGDCEAEARYNLATAELEFSPRGAQGELPDPMAFTPEQIAAILNRWEDFDTWGKAIEARARVLEAQGIDVPGWKVVVTQGRDAWKNKSEAVDGVRANGVDPYEPLTLATPAQIRGRVAEMLAKVPEFQGATKKATVDAARKILAPMLHKPVTGAKLVRDSDPRVALLGGAPEFALTDESKIETPENP